MPLIGKIVKRDLKKITGNELGAIVNQAKREPSKVRYLLHRGLNYRRLRARGFDFDLLSRFLTPGELYGLGAPINELKWCMLRKGGKKTRYLDWKELEKMGVPPIELSAVQIVNSGLSPRELIQKGVPAVEVTKAFRKQREVDEIRMGYRARGGKTIKALLRLHSLGELKKMHVPVRLLLEAKVPLRSLVSEGFSQLEMLKEGVLGPALLEAGGRIKNIIRDIDNSTTDSERAEVVRAIVNAEFTAAHFLSGEISARTLIMKGFSLKDLHDMGFSAKALLKERFKVKELIEATFSLMSIHGAGVPLSTMISLVPAQRFLIEGFSQDEINQAHRELKKQRSAEKIEKLKQKSYKHKKQINASN
ncbi:MAG: hypothetical protein WC634_03410 [archaeon]